MKAKLPNIIAALLTLWGLSSMAGHLSELPTLKGLGLASCCAPFTKVFSSTHSLDDARKFETFACDFELHYDLPDNRHHRIDLSAEIYQQLSGPYMRRNVYGAVLAYGPALPQKLRQSTLRYALVHPATAASELGIPTDASNITIKLTPKNAELDTTPFYLSPSH